MRSTWHIFCAVVCLLFSYVSAGHLVARPGGIKAIKITKENTVNATTTRANAPRIWELIGTSQTAGQLNLSLVNNLASDNVNIYVTGLDAAGVLVLLQPDGTWYYPAATNASVPQPVTANVATPLGPQGSITNVTLPGYISAGRIWFADGELQFFTVNGGAGPALVEPSAVNPADPSASVNWGFVELTWGESEGIYANISYVDFVGLPLGMQLMNSAGITQSANGVSAGAVTHICEELTAQAAADGQPWDQLCMVGSNGVPLRVLSPTQYLSINNTAFEQYWADYIEDVWDFYTMHNLTVDTQAAAGLVNCSVPVNSTQIQCEGDNRGYSKPTPSDIFGCNSGPFGILGGDNGVHYAVVPRLCAAFHRTTTLITPGGNLQPGLSSDWYYQQYPTNQYSKVVHAYEVDGKGYAFAYDDVTPEGADNESGLLADPNPVLLTLTVGGPSCVGSACISPQNGVQPVSLPSSSSSSSLPSTTSTVSSSSLVATSSTSTLPSTTSSTPSTSSTSLSSTTSSTSPTSSFSKTKSAMTASSQSTTSTSAKSTTTKSTSTTTKSTSTKSTSTKSTSTKSTSPKSKSSKSSSTQPTTEASTPEPTLLTCPDSNGTLYTSNSQVYVVQCYLDRPGGDIGRVSVSTLNDCIAACATTPTCIDISWADGWCYMKNVLLAASTVDDVWGAQMLSTVAASSATSAAATTTRKSIAPKKTKAPVVGVPKQSSKVSLPKASKKPAIVSASRLWLPPARVTSAPGISEEDGSAGY